MTTRDFARFGLLYMQHGIWEGEQIVPGGVGRRIADVGADLRRATAISGGSRARRTRRCRPICSWRTATTASTSMSSRASDLVVVRNGHYDKFDGPPIADPQLFLRYPSDGLSPGGGTLPPDSWSHAEFLAPILASIQ